LPATRKPARIGLLETPGWKGADAQAKAALAGAIERIGGAGVQVCTRTDHRGIALLEDLLERGGFVSHSLVNYESVWPLNAYRDRDPGKLSSFLLERLAEAEKMTPADYRALLSERTGARAAHAALADDCDALITLGAPGVAPTGLESTGDPVFNIPASYLGAPALNLPLFMIDGLPLGLQVIGAVDRDADLFGVGGWLMDQLTPV